jgi:hypothetical protein
MDDIESGHDHRMQCRHIPLLGRIRFEVEQAQRQQRLPAPTGRDWAWG